MTNSLKPYKDYKDVDLLWLDRLPSHWKVVDNKELWAERNIRNCTEEELLSVTIRKGIIKQKELIRTSSKKDLSNLDKSNYKLVIENDIAYNKMRMWQGAVGKSKYRGIVSPAYIVLKPRTEMNTDYFQYLLRTPQYIGESYRYSYGMCDDQLNLRYEDFKRMKNIVPPIDEQNQIVRFLNSNLAKINKFINTKKKIISALKEQKQAVINEAVTNGINRNVKMKFSGIDWLGDIPEHWEVRKMKYLGKFINGYAFPSDRFTDEGVRVIKISNIQTMNIDWTDESYVDESYYWERSAFRVLNGDLVLALTRPIISTGIKAAFVYSNDRVLLNQRNALFRAKEKLTSSWLYYVIFNSDFMKTFDQKIDKTGQQPNISTIDIQNISIPLPSVGEQQEIVEYLESKIRAVNNSISIIEREIDLITEYRTSLISDVVTGKIDVRDIVVEEVEEEELETDDLVDNDEVVDSEECEV